MMIMDNSKILSFSKCIIQMHSSTTNNGKDGINPMFFQQFSNIICYSDKHDNIS